MVGKRVHVGAIVDAPVALVRVSKVTVHLAKEGK